MATANKIDRTELAIWAEGTDYTTDQLVAEYREYCEMEIAAGREPTTEGKWANRVKGLPN
jgi:hypothetical protein